MIRSAYRYIFFLSFFCMHVNQEASNNKLTWDQRLWHYPASLFPESSPKFLHRTLYYLYATPYVVSPLYDLLTQQMQQVPQHIESLTASYDKILGTFLISASALYLLQNKIIRYSGFLVAGLCLHQFCIKQIYPQRIATILKNIDQYMDNKIDEIPKQPSGNASLDEQYQKLRALFTAIKKLCCCI